MESKSNALRVGCGKKRKRGKEVTCDDEDGGQGSGEGHHGGGGGGNSNRGLGPLEQIVDLQSRTWTMIIKDGRWAFDGVVLANFSQLLAELRELLLCQVCENLLSSRAFLLQRTSCGGHPRCADCVQGEPAQPCRNGCRIDKSDFKESELLNLTLESYKMFCKSAIRSEEFVNMIQLKWNADPFFRSDAMSLIANLKEGARKSYSCLKNDFDYEQPVDQQPPSNGMDSQFGGNDLHFEIDEGNISRSSSPHDSVSTLVSDVDMDYIEVPSSSSSCSTTSTPSPSPVKREPLDIKPNLSTSVFIAPDAVSKLHPNIVLSSSSLRPPDTKGWPDMNKVIEYTRGGLEQFDILKHNRNGASGSGPVSSSSKSLPISVLTPVRGTTMTVQVPGAVVVSKSQTQTTPVNKPRPKPKTGCRCGAASTNQGNLTCCGQRCPCYIVAKACFDCKCKGCRNPHLPGGRKLLQGINAVYDSNTKTTVPLPMPIGSGSGPGGSAGTYVHLLQPDYTHNWSSLPVNIQVPGVNGVFGAPVIRVEPHYSQS